MLSKFYQVYLQERDLLGSLGVDLEDIGINEGNCVDLTQDRDYWRTLMNAALNLRVP